MVSATLIVVVPVVRDGEVWAEQYDTSDVDPVVASIPAATWTVVLPGLLASDPMVPTPCRRLGVEIDHGPSGTYVDVLVCRESDYSDDLLEAVRGGRIV